MYKLKLKNGNFLGRGVTDMKHAIAAYMNAVDNLQHELDAYDFGIMITSDEEVGGYNGVKPLVQELGYKPKVAIVPDGGSNWELETFAKGVCWIKLEASGKSAHASRPWEGDSAIARLLGAIKDIEALVPSQPTPKDTSISIGTINGGSAPNQVSDSASAVLDIRTGSVEDHALLKVDIKKICKQHGVVMEIQGDSPPCVTDPSNSYISPMLEIIEGITGKKQGMSYDYGATDGRFFNQAGIPTIIVNPNGDSIHSDNEWMSRSSFADFCNVIEIYIRRMARKSIPATNKLVGTPTPNYVWYAAYGAGLAKENFMTYIRGGYEEGDAHTYQGCADTAPPLEEKFVSLPYTLRFVRPPDIQGGGFVTIDPTANPAAHTIARLYLITLDQFEEIVAGHRQAKREHLPLDSAIQHGYAVIGDGTGHFDHLVYCGDRGGYPILTLTANNHPTATQPPALEYTHLLCKGLSENNELNAQGVIDYVLETPGLGGNTTKRELEKIFKDTKSRTVVK